MNGSWLVGGMENSFSRRKGIGVGVSQGPTKKREGDVMPSHGVIHTPSVSIETTPSISTRGNNVANLLDFMIELVLHKSYSWAFCSYMLKFDISLWASLLYTNHFACFLFHHLNWSIWNEMISKWTLTFRTHFAIRSRIGERRICQLALTMFAYKIYKVCNFQCKLWVTLKWSKSNNIIIIKNSCDCVPVA